MNDDTNLIDISMLQQLQDQFCCADHLYLMCVDKNKGVVTKPFGTEEQVGFLRTQVDKHAYMELVDQMQHDRMETVVERETAQDFMKLCAVSTKVEDQLQVVWIVMGIIKERLTPEVHLPEGMLITTEEQFYASVEFLSLLSGQLFESRRNQMIAQKAVEKSSVSELAMEYQLHRSRAMTEILQMMDSDNSFEKVAEDILRETCESLEISGGCLLRENTGENTADMICEYTKEPDKSILAEGQHIPIGALPFYNGKTYMISSDSIMPEPFAHLFKTCHISAGIFEPIEIQNRTAMYFCVYDNEKTRIWENRDIKFVSDVRRVVQSIMLKRIAKNSLASSYTSLEAILENTGCGIYVVDYHTHAILYMNHKFKELFSRSIAGNHLEKMLFSDRETKSSQYYEEIYSVVEERWLDVHKTEIDWVDGRKVAMCTLYDITEKKIYQKEIENQANNDFLTGLFNRMRCEQDLGQFIRKTREKDATGALLYMGLDDFKHINDGLGHQYGDILLKAISHSLRRIDGIENTCYRMGGDEFVVIIPDSVYPELERIVREVTSIFKKPWFLKGEDYYCTISMGIVYFPKDGETVEELVRKADIALLSAKRRGKNRVEYYDGMDASSSYRRLDLEKNMRTAAMNACTEFEVFYQPIIDVCQPGEPCCGAEALIRWNSSALGFVNPADFIPLAEYLGLINPIGEYVMKNAALRCKYWNDMGHPEYHVNVNLSVVQLLQNDIVKKVAKVLEETRIIPQNLTLEVTESLAINDMVRMKKILSEIRNLGVRVALDDFGTGYSSLNHIREMPLDVIKIDRCFIEHLGEDDFSNAFVRMVSELANAINVRVCVEGVETKRQRDIVKKMGIRMIQGFFYGKPMKIEEFEKKYLI